MPKLIKQVAHACIFAHDLDETERFYADVFGMEKVFSFTRNGAVIGYYLDAGGRTFIEVFEKAEAEFSEKNAINHICLEVHSMDETVTHIQSCGVSITEKSNGCDDTWQAWTQDPNGVKIELFEYTGESAQFVGRDRVAHW